MSYDISIGSFDANYTFNVAALFYDHIPAERSRGGLHELDGLTGRQAVDVLQAAFERVNRTYLSDWSSGEVGAATFRARYDAANGWGSTVGGLIFLSRILAACAANPRKRVRVHA